MDVEGAKGVPSQRALRVTQVLLRIMACATTAVAAIIMAFNREIVVFGNVQMQADFTTVSTLKFFVGGSAIVSGCCLFTLPLVVAHQGKSGIIHVIDLLIFGLAVASASAAMAVSYVGKYGDESAGWMPVCGYFPHFCNKSEVSLVLSFVGCVFCYIFCVTQPVSKPAHLGGGGGGGGGSGSSPVNP